MTRARHLLLSGLCAAALAAAVIIIPGYFESMSLLVFQVAFTFGPVFFPYLVLSMDRKRPLSIWIVCSAMLMLGWGYVIYIDTRPYAGGGASFAILIGWTTSAVVTVLAVVSLSQGRTR